MGDKVCVRAHGLVSQTSTVAYHGFGACSGSPKCRGSVAPESPNSESTRANVCPPPQQGLKDICGVAKTLYKLAALFKATMSQIYCFLRGHDGMELELLHARDLGVWV
ncbi:MAG: hypothetical protein L0Z50_35085 [Verrucomicrobiales bacterium]|nr:hypothetical protein [Verrucomicrobiales bacterium]